MKEMKEEKYLTEDLFVGAYLIHRGASVTGIKPHPNKKNRLMLELEGEDLRTLVQEFYAGKDGFFAFKKTLFELRTLLFEAKNIGRGGGQDG